MTPAEIADWLQSPEVIEALAEQAHTSWAGWTRWMIDQWSPARLERWERQIATPYAELSASEKDSDRQEAMAVVAALLRLLDDTR